MPVDLRDLMTASFDAAAAEAWSKFTLDEADKLALREAAMKVLGLFPGRMAGQCTLMSPAYSIALEKLGTQPGYVVAGSLYIGDKRIFGDDKEFDDKVLFSKSNSGWNGHDWIVYGDYLADVSVFRTADAGSPRLLSKHVAKEYGRGRGFCAWPMARMDPTGLRYVPQYVLTQDQVDALMRGALVMIEQIDAKRGKK